MHTDVERNRVGNINEVTRRFRGKGGKNSNFREKKALRRARLELFPVQNVPSLAIVESSRRQTDTVR